MTSRNKRMKRAKREYGQYLEARIPFSFKNRETVKSFTFTVLSQDHENIEFDDEDIVQIRKMLMTKDGNLSPQITQIRLDENDIPDFGSELAVDPFVPNLPAIADLNEVMEKPENLHWDLWRDSILRHHQISTKAYANIRGEDGNKRLDASLYNVFNGVLNEYAVHLVLGFETPDSFEKVNGVLKFDSSALYKSHFYLTDMVGLDGYGYVTAYCSDEGEDWFRLPKKIVSVQTE